MITAKYHLGYVSSTRKFAVFFSVNPIYAIRLPIVFAPLMQAIESGNVQADDVKLFLQTNHNISLSKSDDIISAAERVGLIVVE